MPKPLELTVTVEQSRSGNYQTVRHALSVRLELTEDDTIEKVLGDWRDYLTAETDYYTINEIERLIAESRGEPVPERRAK